MDDNSKNNLFLVAIDYLFKEKFVNTQKDLAQKIGITETSLSRIKKGQRVVSDETLRKMNEAFGHIFNMAYFRGRSTKLLIEDANYHEQHPEEDRLRNYDEMLQRDQEHDTPIAAEDADTPYTPIPLWASSFIEIMAQQVKQNEVLNRELRMSIKEVNELKTNLQNLISNLKKQPNVLP